MKRLIQYTQPYNDDAFDFSDCSTKFTVLPVVVNDDTGDTELLAAAKKLGIVTKGKALKKTEKNSRFSRITNAIALPEGFLGFIQIPRSDLPIAEKTDGKLTEEQCREIVDCQECGVQDVGEHVDGQYILVKSGWDFYVDLRLLGYNHEQFLEVMGAEDYGFYDDTSMCSCCCKYNDNDNGYVSNFREVAGEWVGVECGCYKEAMEDFSRIENEFMNNPERAVERDVAEQHEKDGNLFFIERFIGGFVDHGRGGFFAGNSVRNGQPDRVAKALDSMGVNFVFSHDESGQFQTYWSAYAVNKNGKKITKRTLASIQKKLAETRLE